MLMISAPYQMWLGTKLKAGGASAAVEYTRGFMLDLSTARSQLGLNQGALLERERAMRAIRQRRELRSLIEVGTTAVIAYTSVLP